MSVTNRSGLPVLLGFAVAMASTAIAGDPPPSVGTTINDFFQPGTQPLMPGFRELLTATQCEICHANYGMPDVEPGTPWRASMMGQAARDPVFRAGLTIANQDAEGVGEYCVRCHAPDAFLKGDSQTNPDDFDAIELEGINCNFCHRMVDPLFDPDRSPPEDESILDDLAAEGLLPAEGGNARFIADPDDSRRGPFDDLPFNPHIPNPEVPPVIVSPFHTASEFCWTCHDVSNPIVTRTEDDRYELNDLDSPHPTADQFEMFPLHRTYSEWKNSYYFTTGGVQHDGRFGGNHATGIMEVCQDCHMPDQNGFGCSLGGFPERPNVPQHSFIGSNTWVLNAVRSIYSDAETGLTEQSVEDAIARNINLLELASDLAVSQLGDTLEVRIINQTGHKLPTGFPDGRRMWINVKVFDTGGDLVAEHGAYDFKTGELTAGDTKVYEITLGIGEKQAAEIGREAGPTLHFVLANEILKDNRIPPQGYSPVIAEQNQSLPVGVTYGDGQHWDDTVFEIPGGGAQAVVTVYYQVTSKEFIDFLRDANFTDATGQLAHDQWVLHGRSAPVVMDMAELDLNTDLPGDLNGDGVVNAADLAILLGAWGPCDGCPVDLNGDGVVNAADLAILLGNWTG